MLQRNKQTYVYNMLQSRDFVGIAEAHSTAGKVFAWSAPDGLESFWSHGTNTVGGIGLILKKTFLANPY